MMRKTGSSSSTPRRRHSSQPSSLWSDVPTDLLASIAEGLLPNAADLVRFGAVCRSWQSVAAKEQNTLARQLPWLLLAEEEEDSSSSSSSSRNKLHRLYSHSDDKIYELAVPRTRGKFCCGSYAGWIATVDKNSEMQLVNPFIGATLDLPRFDTFNVSFYQGRDWAPELKRDLLVPKVCLSSSPSSAGRLCIVVAFYGSGARLAYARPRDHTWHAFDGKWHPYSEQCSAKASST